MLENLFKPCFGQRGLDNRQAVSTAGASTLQRVAAIAVAHSHAKSVRRVRVSVIRLVSTLHKLVLKIR